MSDCPLRTLEALAGSVLLLKDGSVLSQVESREGSTPMARTAIGLSAAAERMLVVVVDGRQPFYSEGLSLRETAELLAELGARDALALDGGGSSTLAVRAAGRVVTLNSPCQASVPLWQRPVANQLAVYAKALPE